MQIQQWIDLRTARQEAATLGLQCNIHPGDDTLSSALMIYMSTGEIEPASNLFEALRIIQAYAALSAPSTTRHKEQT